MDTDKNKEWMCPNCGTNPDYQTSCCRGLFEAKKNIKALCVDQLIQIHALESELKLVKELSDLRLRDLISEQRKNWRLQEGESK